MSERTTPSGGYRSAALSKAIGYYAAFIALGLSMAALGPTLPDLAARTGTQLRQISLVFTVHSLGYLIGSFQGGRLFDRFKGHLLIGGVLAVMAATMALVPAISQFWVLIAVLVLLGAASGALDAGCNTLLVWVYKEKVAPFMNALHFFFGVGAFLSPIIIARVALGSDDALNSYWVLAALTLPVILWIARLPSPTAEKGAQDDGTGQAKPGLIALLVIFFFLYTGTEGSFGGWIFTYAVELGLSDETTAAYLTSVFWGSLTVGRLLSIPIAVRFKPQTVLIADLVGCLVSITILLVSNSMIAVWIGVFGIGLSMASIFPTLISLAERRMKITGQITGWFFVGASTGNMTLPWLIGQLFESIGPRVMMVTVLIDLLAAAGIMALLTIYSNRVADKPAPTVSV
jgi:FHS family Na+ dependent glucose MFS transporter 1